MEGCKGHNCGASEVHHSLECLEDHEEAYGVPKCFVRAEYLGRVFDNCVFFKECIHRKAVCVNNPVVLSKKPRED